MRVICCKQLQPWDGVSADIPAYIEIICDDESELPASPSSIVSGFVATIGSTAHVVSNQLDYEMKTNGQWVVKQTTDVAALVTRISNLENEMSGVHSDIDILVNQVDELHDVAVHLIDDGAKNKIPTPTNAQTLSGVTYTPDTDGRIVTSNTASGNSFYIASNLDLVAGEELTLTGCPSGGSYSNGFALYIAKNVSGATTLAYDEGDGVTFTVPETANYNIRIIVRNGTNMNGKTFEPMLTYPEYLRYSTKFVPYSPSNAELYRIIRGYHL